MLSTFKTSLSTMIFFLILNGLELHFIFLNIFYPTMIGKEYDLESNWG